LDNFEAMKKQRDEFCATGLAKLVTFLI
jgi:hypothetical protein